MTTYEEFRQSRLREDVVNARDAVEALRGPARRYRWTTRGCVVGIVVGGLGATYCVVAAALSTWVDFGPTAVPATVVLSLALLGSSIAALVAVVSDATSSGLTPLDQLFAARRRFDEAYAAYLATGPVNVADVYLRPRDGRKTR